MELAERWVLADKMAVPALQNLVVSKIIAIREKTFKIPTWTFTYIYQRTAIESTLRILMVSLIAQHYPPRRFSKDAQLFSHEFLIDLAEHTTARMCKDYENKVDASEFFVSLPREEKATGGS